MDHNSAIQASVSEYYWYLTDHFGTPQKMIYSNGTFVWSALYDLFGNILIETKVVENNLRFADQYYDAETWLNYKFNRYYDPEIGKLILLAKIARSLGEKSHSVIR